MRRNLRNRQVRFIHQDGLLVRTVTSPDGRSYVHRCELEVYEKVAWALEEASADGKGTGINEIALKEDLPHTQVHVSIEFLHERGLIERRRRLNCAVTPAVHLDAMVEWHALREKTD